MVKITKGLIQRIEEPQSNIEIIERIEKVDAAVALRKAEEKLNKCKRLLFWYAEGNTGAEVAQKLLKEIEN